MTDKDVKPRPLPKGVLPDDAMIEVSDVQGHVVAVSMVAGEPVLKVKSAFDDKGSGLAVPVPEGQRTYTIQANTAGFNVARFVRPGDIVDVPLNLRGDANDETGGGTTTTATNGRDPGRGPNVGGDLRENHVGS